MASRWHRFCSARTRPLACRSPRGTKPARPPIIATGGVNRHNGIVEDREFARQLTEAGVPDSTIRAGNQSKETWQNVELSLPTCARRWPEAAPSRGHQVGPPADGVQPGHPAPEATPFYAISGESAYAGTLVTRTSWPKIPTAAACFASPRKSPAGSPKEPTAPPGRLTGPGRSPDARSVPISGSAADSSCLRAGRSDVFCSTPKVNLLPGQLAFSRLSAPSYPDRCK